MFGVLAAISFWFGRHRGRLIDEQTSLESIRATPWKQFEFLVAEAYRRQGYQVDFSLGQGADGGVDLVLRKAGRTSLVQCKQWKTVSVGAPVIREMFGLMVAENANETIIVTSGNFTRDAQSFAEGKPIRLVDGPQLLALVRSVQSAPAGPAITPATGPRQPESPTSPTCPQCGKAMVLRTARRGAKTPGTGFGDALPIPIAPGHVPFSPAVPDRLSPAPLIAARRNSGLPKPAQNSNPSLATGRRNASRNAAQVPSVSDRALISAFPTLTSFAHDGISPQRMSRAVGCCSLKKLVPIAWAQCCTAARRTAGAPSPSRSAKPISLTSSQKSFASVSRPHMPTVYHTTRTLAVQPKVSKQDSLPRRVAIISLGPSPQRT